MAFSWLKRFIHFFIDIHSKIISYKENRGVRMLQEATKIFSSAFGDNFLKKLTLYLHDCVREEVKSSTFRNLNQDKENKWYFLDNYDNLLFSPEESLLVEGTNSEITELLIQADISQKDRYLIYGFLFLTGKNSKGKRGEEFLTPLLYVPCKLEREGINIKCTLSDESISINTGALAELVKYDDEDKIEHILEGLIGAVPELPLTEEGIQIFLTTLKSIVPEIEIKNTSYDLSISERSALILTKRPTITAGLLHELTQISDMPSGIFRETALNVIQEEFSKSKKSKSTQTVNFDDKKYKKEEGFYPITPLDLSDSQKKVIESTKEHPLVAVYGPPGTGKSQTIVNLVSHLVASGKTVLVASRMDKAVDVVSDRLNGLGAPFLSLRAGRANYQKQLNYQLQELLSSKVDLDSGYEMSILTSPDDMKRLFKHKIELEHKFMEILELENSWYEALEGYKKEIGLSENECIIKAELTTSEIKHFKDLLDKIEHSISKSGFISKIFTAVSYKKMCSRLQLTDIELTEANIQLIRTHLIIKEKMHKLKSIENNITKKGNLHQIIDNLRELRIEQKELSANILKNKRREALKAIIRDQSKRQALYIHSKALVERKKNLQNRLLQDEDFKPLLEAFPCWAITTYAISESLPLKPGLFDVAIIDEASQCDIASCVPILFRAKSAIIVGDDKQLNHLSFLEKSKEQSFLSKYGIPDRYQVMWRFRSNSIFDLANFYSAYPILLDEHFRSRPPIINFSNREFYGERIKIITKELTPSDCIDLVIVEGGTVDPENTRNMAEVEKIMLKLQEIIIEEEKNNIYNPSSIGIISPFRGQVDLVKKAICQVIPD